jgi:L-aspartate oxidase
MELRNLTAVGELILMSALQRRESRGGHYCADYPIPVPKHPRTTVIGRGRAAAGGDSVRGGGNSISTRPRAPQLVGVKVPLSGKLAAKNKKGSAGLSKRARVREVALKSQKKDAQ